MAEEDTATVIFPAPPFEEGPTLPQERAAPEPTVVAPTQAGPQGAIAMAPPPEDLSVQMRLHGTGIIGPAGAHVPIQVIAGLQETTVRMEPPLLRGAIVHTVEAIRPLGVLLQAIGVPAAAEVINPQEDLHQATVATIDHLREHPEVPVAIGAVAAVQGVLAVTEVPAAALQEAPVEQVGPQDLPAQVEVVEDRKFQNSIV